jgi:hypothetical protein
MNVRERRYLLPGGRVYVSFVGRPGNPPDVWIVERPGPEGAGSQVRLTHDEWEHLVSRARVIRALAHSV